MRIVLLLDEGGSYRDIEEKLGVPPSTISRWKQRYQEDGLLGLATIHPGQPPQKLTPQFRARVLERTRQAPPDGSTHWSLRKMAAVMKVNKNLIARIWKEADLKPHRFDRYMASNDPQFEQKAAAIIGLYLNPPQNAAVFCVDEKSAIQALDRLDRRLPLSPGRAEKHGFEYHRHGTLSLYAALNPQTGEILGQTAPRHTSQEFVAFLEEVVAHPADRAGSARHPGQLCHSQNGLGEGLPAAAPQRDFALHANLLVLAQSSRELVQQASARRDRSRHLHLRRRSETQNPALHSPLSENSQTFSLEILRCPQTDSGVVAIVQGQPTSSPRDNFRPVGKVPDSLTGLKFATNPSRPTRISAPIGMPARGPAPPVPPR